MFIHFNGNLLEADTPLVTANNRGLRYGDGLFETMKLVKGNIPLFKLHVDRLFTSLAVLQMIPPSWFTPSYLQKSILELSSKNNLAETATRIRMSVFRGDGGLQEWASPELNLIIQTSSLPDSYNSFNQAGISVNIYKEVTKSCDILSNLKSNNYLPYIMAGIYSKKQGLDDSIILNTQGRVCDASIANVFCIDRKVIYTPPLSEGCVAGVMRRYLIESMLQDGYELREKSLSIQELEDADEIFLTNALYGIRPVKYFAGKEYQIIQSASLYKTYINH